MSQRLLPLMICFFACWGVHDETLADPPQSEFLTLVCDEENDLYKALVLGGHNPRRFDCSSDAVESAASNSALLILAENYPERRTVVSPEVLVKAKAKDLNLLIEYPAEYPEVEFSDPQGVRWERAIVASSDFSPGLERLQLLLLHDCQFLPTTAESSAIVIGRVAGFNHAVFGVPHESYPLLFQASDGTWIATSQISNFVRARYSPTREWKILWEHFLMALAPNGAPYRLVYEPRVSPKYQKDETLPANAEFEALAGCTEWYKNSRLLITPERQAELHRLLKNNEEVVAVPSVDAPAGNGSLGILEGYASQILPDGNQLQRTPIRADCQAETAAVLALHADLAGDAESRVIAENLMRYLYFDSELCQRERGDPKHPAYGLIGWGAVSDAWHIANYGDDNARTLLATMVCAAALESDAWDEPLLRALYANLRTTGKLGFRGDRIDISALEVQGWRAFSEAETVNVSPFFEAYLWACYLWAYDRTGDQQFLDKTLIGIRETMKVYPDGWRWGDNLDRSRMLLALAWLVRVDDQPEHRHWLNLVASDLIRHQQACGAIPEQLSNTRSGHYLAPASNEAYGTTETPLIQENGDTVSDQLYVTSFVLLGLREAVAATGDTELQEAEDRLADYLVRIQVQSEAVPYLNGTWFRAFDYDRWDYWSSSGDVGWGAWCAETGWGPAWSGITFGLRSKETSLWDLTKRSRISAHREKVQEAMSRDH